MLGTLPDGTTQVSSLLKGLGDLVLTTGFGNGQEAIVLALDFGSAENAQTVNGLAMGGLMPLKQLAASSDDDDPEAQLGKAVVNSIQVKVDGSVMTVGVSIPWKMMVDMAEAELADAADDAEDIAELAAELADGDDDDDDDDDGDDD